MRIFSAGLRGSGGRPVILPIGPGIFPPAGDAPDRAGDIPHPAGRWYSRWADDIPDGPVIFPIGLGIFPPAGDIPDGSEDKGVKGTFLISGGNIFQAGRGYPRVSLAPGTHISHKSLPWTGTWQPYKYREINPDAIALRSPASERSSDLKRYSPDMRTTKV